jgi:ABC-2 type transport system ATP-binding protein
MHPELTVRETLEMFAGYYRHPRPIDDTIAKVGLEDDADQRVSRLSGGRQRRLDVGVALVGDPELLFLDEPTTGFDPSARRRAWDVIAGLRDLGKTVFLTTHYMDEAQVLADRAAIIAAGRIVAEGRPDQLGSEHPTTEIRFRLPNGVGAGELPLDGAKVEVSAGFVTAATGEPVQALNRLTAWALERGVDLVALEVGAPTLEDTYLELTSGADQR